MKREEEGGGIDRPTHVQSGNVQRWSYKLLFNERHIKGMCYRLYKKHSRVIYDPKDL